MRVKMRLQVLASRLFSGFLSMMFMVSITSAMNYPPAIRDQVHGHSEIDQFDLLTPSSGWVMLDEQLFWTSDFGQSWAEIGPSLPAGTSVQDVEFIDADTGWLVGSVINLDGSAELHLSKTMDRGSTWTTFSPFSPDDTPPDIERAEMSWLDIQRGWLSVEQTSGSNFSLGILFSTSDSGRSWDRSTLPVAGRVVFRDAQTGWLVGGPANDRILKTHNAGSTWEEVHLDGRADDGQVFLYPPAVAGASGLLVTTEYGPDDRLSLYALDDSSTQWPPLDRIQLNAQPGRIGLSIRDTRNFVATVPGTESIVRMVNGTLERLENEDGRSASIIELDMVSPDSGWAKSVDSICVTGPASDTGVASVSCSSSTHLLRTDNGGATWQNVTLPSATSPKADFPEFGSVSESFTTSSAAALENTEVLIGQGFDRCEIPTLSQMQTWSAASPYRAVNLYVGGSSRACANTALTSAYLFLLNQQGWKFIPTWVGPQAPCTGYLSRMSSDVATAYNQGVTEANLAVDRLSALGLTDPGETGSVIYYDIEHYGTNTACRSAVNAFMNGWVSQIRALGNVAGVYGSTLCDTGLSDFLNITNVPDVVWPARWYHNLGSGFYNPDASVWNLGSCIPNIAWSTHQRIRQYEGDHNETWGNLTLDIDSNVLDGVVAIPHDYPFVSQVTRQNSNPTNASSVRFTVTFSKPVTGVDASDFGLSTNGVTGASVGTVTGSGITFTVTVNTGTGDGSIRLNILDNNSIVDAANLPLGGSNIGGGSFTYGETYTVIKTSNVSVTIGGSPIANYIVPVGSSLRVDYPGVDSGPVKITHMNGRKMIAALRAVWKMNGTFSSYSELMGLPKEQLSSEYYFPWYNNTSSMLDQQIRFGNADSTTTRVEVSVGGQVLGTYELGPGQSLRQSFAMDNGPLRVRSLDGKKIIAAMRAVWKADGQMSSYAELMGLPKEQLSSEYYFPWYNNSTTILDEQFRFGNVDTTATRVEVSVGSQVLGAYDLDPGESMRVSFDGLDNGPIRIRSLDGKKIIAAMRAVWKMAGEFSSYSELMGLPAEHLSSDYYFPWYNFNVPSLLDEQFRFGNVDTQPTTVEVSVGGTVLGIYDLDPGESIREDFPGLDNGPIRIRSLDGKGIIAAVRAVWKRNGEFSSYSELMGLPKEQLTTEYYFPWYNNNAPTMLNEQFRLGVP